MCRGVLPVVHRRRQSPRLATGVAADRAV